MVSLRSKAVIKLKWFRWMDLHVHDFTKSQSGGDCLSHHHPLQVVSARQFKLPLLVRRVGLRPHPVSLMSVDHFAVWPTTDIPQYDDITFLLQFQFSSVGASHPSLLKILFVAWVKDYTKSYVMYELRVIRVLYPHTLG